MLNPVEIAGILAEAASDITSNPNDVTVLTAKLAAKLASMVAADVPEPTEEEVSLAHPLDLVDNLLGDLKEGEKYFSKVNNFLKSAQNAESEADLVSLAIDEILGSGFKLDLTMTKDGKEITMIKGSDIISLGKSVLKGDPLNSKNLVTGVITNFEKSIFGFSVLETVKSFEGMLEALDKPTAADVKLATVTNTLQNIISNVSGPRLTPLLTQMLSSVSTLASVKSEADALMKKAKDNFKKDIDEVITNPPEPEVPEIPPQDEFEDSAPPATPSDGPEDQDEILDSAKDQEEEDPLYYV